MNPNYLRKFGILAVNLPEYTASATTQYSNIEYIIYEGERISGSMGNVMVEWEKLRKGDEFLERAFENKVLHMFNTYQQGQRKLRSRTLYAASENVIEMILREGISGKELKKMLEAVCFPALTQGLNPCLVL